MASPDFAGRREHPTPSRQKGTFPTFLIAGAPHSGAGTLGDLLRWFPTVHIPAEESQFFESRYQLGPRWYQDRFHPPVDAEVVGDVSTATLGYDTDHTLVAARVDGFLPRVHVVAVIRHPVERASAHLRALIKEGRVEPDLTIEEYVGGTSERSIRQEILFHGLYGQHLLPFVRRFRERLQLLDYRELTERPSATIATVASFIGAPLTEDPRIVADQVISSRRCDVPQRSHRALEPYFEDDLEALYRATGFRFETPDTGEPASPRHP